MVSSLIGAATALPLFRPAVVAARSLADGAPSKHGGAVNRSASAHSMVEVGTTLWSGGAVKLANDGDKRLVKEPRDEATRKRYEELFDELLVKQEARVRSNASTIREAVQGERKPSGVQALKGWFESDSTSSTMPPSSSTSAAPAGSTGSNDASLSPQTVRKVWRRSRLSSSFLAKVWDQAVSATGGVDKESFVRAMAGIDAELERRKQRREGRRRAASGRKGGAGSTRRVPPPPPASAGTVV